MNTELHLDFPSRGCSPTVAWQDRGCQSWGQDVRHLIIFAGVVGALLLSVSLWLEEGEVVALVTQNDQGHEFETLLWIVDLEGVPYLRAESDEASWLDRIRARPDVELERAGRRAPYRAIPLDDARIREAVSREMSEKYGDLDRALVLLWDHTGSVPIRLQGRPPEDPMPHSDRRVGAAP